MSEADDQLALTAAMPVGQPVNPIATEAMDAARAYAREALAPETLRAYAADWRHFAAWCLDAGCPSLPAPPLAVAAYLAALAGLYSRSALERRLGAVGQQHRLRGLGWAAADPGIRPHPRGGPRRPGSRQRQAAAPPSVPPK